MPFTRGARFALLPAALSGMGLAVLPCYIADAEPALVRLLGPREVVARELWLVLHRDSRRIGRIRALADHLTAEIEAQAASLQGEEPAAPALASPDRVSENG